MFIHLPKVTHSEEGSRGLGPIKITWQEGSLVSRVSGWRD